MATFDVAKLLNKITQDIPGINTVLKALAKWDVSALSDVPDGAMQATTDANNNLTIKKKVSGSYTPVTKLMHDVDKLDGYHASASATANAVAVRNASGALPGNILGNAVTADKATALATGAVVPVNQGGTGATTASQACANLGVADGADFTTHIAKQASPSVEGHVKLDALAADGSNTAAPGGFGWGTMTPVASDLNTLGGTCLVWCNPGTTANRPPAANYHACVFHMRVNAGTALQYHYANGGLNTLSRRQTSSVWSDWTLLPKGLTDSTSTVASDIAASATAVKAVNDTASDALARTAPATTTSLGIGRVATSADLVDGATINNGPAFLAAGDSSVRAWLNSLGDVGDILASLATSKTGYLLCNGGAYSRTTYSALFALIGTSFGAGNGSTTFNLPDARGRTMQGANGNLMAVLAAGLPNVTAHLTGCDLGSNGVLPTDGAASLASSAPVQNGGATNWNTENYYKLSLQDGNAIYGNSTTVQPPAISVNIFIKY